MPENNTNEDSAQDPDEFECESSGAELLNNYLQSEKGHELASKIVMIFESLQKNTAEKSIERVKLDRFLQIGVLLVVILAASTLTWYGKFDPTLAVLFGTMVGYLFGKRGT